jgi:hypothetical protein
MVLEKARSAFCDEAGTFFKRTASFAEIFCHKGGFFWFLVYSTLLHLPPSNSTVSEDAGIVPGLLRLWHGQPDALTTWLHLIHIYSAIVWVGFWKYSAIGIVWVWETFCKTVPKKAMGLGSILQYDGVGLERFLWFDVLGLGNILLIFKVFCLWTMDRLGFGSTYSAFEWVCFGKDSAFRLVGFGKDSATGRLDWKYSAEGTVFCS